MKSTLTSKLAVAAVLAFGISTAAEDAAAQTVNLRAGQTRSFGLKKRLAGRPMVQTSNSNIVRAWFNSSTNRLYIRGVRSGRARVLFAGRFMRINAGSNVPIASGRPFRYVITVNVRGSQVRTRTRTINLSVSRGRTRTYQLRYLLGRYRNVVGPQVGGANVIGVRMTNGRISFTGRRRGRAVVAIQAMRWNYNSRQWDRYRVTIRIRVV